MTDRIEKTIEISAPITKVPITKVWHALTDYVEFGKWFGVKLDGPFIPGEVSTGRITYPGYEHIKWEVKVKQLVEPKLFSFTWHPYAHDATVDYSAETPTLVEFRLEPTVQGTRLSMVETGFESLPIHRQPDALRMNDSGWTEQLANVRAHVEA